MVKSIGNIIKEAKRDALQTVRNYGILSEPQIDVLKKHTVILVDFHSDNPIPIIGWTPQRLTEALPWFSAVHIRRLARAGAVDCVVKSSKLPHKSSSTQSQNRNPYLITPRGILDLYQVVLQRPR